MASNGFNPASSSSVKTVDYVKYLLEGSGAEAFVDYTQLKRELENMSTPQTDVSDFNSPALLTGMSQNGNASTHRNISNIVNQRSIHSMTSSQNDPHFFATPYVERSSNGSSINQNNNANDNIAKTNSSSSMGTTNSFNSKFEIESLNAALKREGFEILPMRLFHGLTRSTILPLTAKFYEVLSGHHFLRQKSEEFGQAKKELEDQVGTLVKNSESLEKARLDAEERVKQKENEVRDLKAKIVHLQSKISLIEVESNSIVYDKDPYMKKLKQDFDYLESKMRKSREETEIYIRTKLGRDLTEKDKEISELIRPLIEKNQDYKIEVDELKSNVKNLESKEIEIKKAHENMTSEAVQASPSIPKPSINPASLLFSKPPEIMAKENLLLRKENEKLHLELAGRPSVREWRLCQRKLKDLENENIAKENLGSTQQFTRRLIRNDKLRNMLDKNSDLVVKVDPDETNEIIKMACLKLKLTDPLTLLSSLDILIEVVKYVPSMERFIREVDAQVWCNDRVLNEHGVPRKLSTTLASLKRILKKARNGEQVTMDDVDGVRDTLTGEVLMDDPVTASMIDHFRDLFDVSSLEGVYPKLNELYVYTQETRTGLKVIASLLNLDTEHMSIVRILEEIANYIRNTTLNSVNQQFERMKQNIAEEVEALTYSNGENYDREGHEYELSNSDGFHNSNNNHLYSNSKAIGDELDVEDPYEMSTTIAI